MSGSAAAGPAGSGLRLDEMHQLLTLLADLKTTGDDHREALTDRLWMFHEVATAPRRRTARATGRRRGPRR